MMFKLLFYSLSALLLTFGILTVTSKRFFRSAVYLLGTLLLTAGIYFAMALNFIAIVQIMIYVGGIVVLILFSILLTNTSDSKVNHPAAGKIVTALVTCVAGFGLSAYLLFNNTYRQSSGIENLGVKTIGNQLLNVNETGYLLPFEVITLLLVVAMISSILIAIDDRKSDSVLKKNLKTNIEKILTGNSKRISVPVKPEAPVKEELEEPVLNK